MALNGTRTHSRAAGFTLIEILVSLTLIAVGLLGLAQLIVKEGLNKSLMMRVGFQSWRESRQRAA